MPPSPELTKINLDMLHWDRFPKAIFSPKELLNDVYAWETNFKNDLFLQNLDLFRKGYGIPGGFYKLNNDSSLKLGYPAGTEVDQIKIPVDQGGKWPESYWEAGFNVTSVPKIDGLSGGLCIVPYLYCDVEKEFVYSTSLFDILMKIDKSLNFEQGLALIFNPPKTVTFKKNLYNSEAFQSLNDYSVSFSLPSLTILMRQFSVQS